MFIYSKLIVTNRLSLLPIECPDSTVITLAIRPLLCASRISKQINSYDIYFVEHNLICFVVCYLSFFTTYMFLYIYLHIYMDKRLNEDHHLARQITQQQQQQQKSQDHNLNKEHNSNKRLTLRTTTYISGKGRNEQHNKRLNRNKPLTRQGTQQQQQRRPKAKTSNNIKITKPTTIGWGPSPSRIQQQQEACCAQPPSQASYKSTHKPQHRI